MLCSIVSYHFLDVVDSPLDCLQLILYLRQFNLLRDSRGHFRVVILQPIHLEREPLQVHFAVTLFQRVDMLRFPSFDSIQNSDIPIFPASLELSHLITAAVGVIDVLEHSAFCEL